MPTYRLNVTGLGVDHDTVMVESSHQRGIVKNGPTYIRWITLRSEGRRAVTAWFSDLTRVNSDDPQYLSALGKAIEAATLNGIVFFLCIDEPDVPGVPLLAPQRYYGDPTVRSKTDLMLKGQDGQRIILSFPEEDSAQFEKTHFIVSVSWWPLEV